MQGCNLGRGRPNIKSARGKASRGRGHPWNAVWQNFNDIHGISLPLVLDQATGYDVQLYDPLNSGPDQAIFSGPAISVGPETFVFGDASLDENQPILLFKATPWYGRMATPNGSELDELVAADSRKQDQSYSPRVWPNPTTGELNIWWAGK